MTDVDPYVEPAAEPAPRQRLAGLRPWLSLAIVLLVLAGWWSMQLVIDRQDPTLQVPSDASDGPVAPALPDQSPGQDG